LSSGDGAGRQAGLLAPFLGFGVFWGGWGALLPAIKRAAGASDSELGAVLLLIALAAMPAMLLAGALTDRIGGRAVAWSLLAFAGAVLLPGFAGSVGWLALALVALGACSGAVDVTINAGVSAFEASEGRRLMNKAHAMFPLGALGSSVLVGIAREAGASPEAILAAIAAALVATALLSLTAPALPRRGARSERPRFSRALLVIGGLCALAYLIENALQGWSAVHLEETLDSSPAIAGLGPGLFAGALFAGRALAQARAQGVAPGLLMALAGALAAAGCALAAAAPAAGVALAGFALAGLGLAVAAPTAIGLAGAGASDATRASAISAVTTISYLGFLAGPPLVGFVAGAGGLRAGMAGLAIVGVLLAAVAPFALRESAARAA
jgi:MFS family permease